LSERAERIERIERPRGTRDFLPEEMEKRRAIEARFREIAESYGYREIATPTFEHLELFTIKSGEGIVEEIYAFKDKSGRDLALRPELTAPAMRLFVNECSVMPRPLRFYYFGNCFRYERPQKGRYREFWQFGVELIGSDRVEADAEVIALAYRMLKDLNIQFELQIGHVGILRSILRDVPEDKSSRIMRLIDKKDQEGLAAYMDEVGVPDDVQERVFQVSALHGSREVLTEAEGFTDQHNLEYLQELCDILDFISVEYTINLGIARGLDYYTGIVFEIYAEGLGAQNQICGGGRYRLTHLFGGDDVPSTGFAIGFDRVSEICKMDIQRKKLVVVVSFPDTLRESLKVAEKLRAKGFRVVSDVMGRNIRKQLSHASDIGADYAIIIGRKEVDEGVVGVKNLNTGVQKSVAINELTEYLV
jgi:histidyl-tRNA synthetase